MAGLTVGSVVYATNQGLGILARDFYENGIVNKVLIQQHGKHENHHDWYPDEDKAKDFEDLMSRCDVILFFETPFGWDRIAQCRKNNVPTVLMPMYECTPEVLEPHCLPDAFICPSDLDYDYFVHYTALGKVVTKCLVPIDSRVTFNLRENANIFVHNAGHGGLNGRNGTKELLEAMKYVKSPIKLIVRYQEDKSFLQARDQTSCGHDNRIDFRKGTVPFEQLYSEGDVFVFPEKFNGLSLPLQEAYASGMFVLYTGRYPMTQWLPPEGAIPVSGFNRTRVGGSMNSFYEAIVSPKEIAKKIDSVYGQPIRVLSATGGFDRNLMSWDALRNSYKEFLFNIFTSVKTK